MRGLRGRKFGNGNMLTADVPNTTNRELFAKKPGSGSEENSVQQASKALNLRETTYERTGLIVDHSHRRQSAGRSAGHACH